MSGLEALLAAASAHVGRVTAAELIASPRGTFLDVREGDERLQHGSIADSVHVPRGRLELGDPLPPDLLVVVCSDGRRATLAASTLLGLGRADVVVLDGGMAAWEAAGGDVVRFSAGAGIGLVEGIGGAFFKASDADALIRWYAETFGIAADLDYRCATFAWRFADSDRAGSTVFSVFPQSTTYFGSSGQGFMINLRVRDLDQALERVRAGGGTVTGGPDDSDYGRFAWFEDPEGHRVELWQAPAGV